MGDFSKDLVTRLARQKSGVGVRSANAFNKLSSSVARVTNNVILGIDTPASGIDKLPLFITVPLNNARITSRYTTTDAAYDIKKKIASEGYYLLIDDKRKVSDLIQYNFEETKDVLVVARTVEKAIECVQKLGLPRFIYFDYHLRNSDFDPAYEDTTLPFIDWLATQNDRNGEKLDISTIGYEVVSSHEHSFKINNRIHEIMDSI